MCTLFRIDVKNALTLQLSIGMSKVVDVFVNNYKNISAKFELDFIFPFFEIIVIYLLI